VTELVKKSGVWPDDVVPSASTGACPSLAARSAVNRAGGAGSSSSRSKSARFACSQRLAGSGARRAAPICPLRVEFCKNASRRLLSCWAVRARPAPSPRRSPTSPRARRWHRRRIGRGTATRAATPGPGQMLVEIDAAHRNPVRSRRVVRNRASSVMLSMVTGREKACTGSPTAAASQ